jgi:hypothetical protein
MLHVSVHQHAPVKETHASRGERGVFRAVSDHHERHSLLVQLAKQAHDLLAVSAVEIAGGFVSEKQRWACGHRTSNRDALLLPPT